MLSSNFAGVQEVSTLAGGTQTIPGGPVAAWEPIKLLSGDTLHTHQPTLIALIVGVTLRIVCLEYLPALALGPAADALL